MPSNGSLAMSTPSQALALTLLAALALCGAGCGDEPYSLVHASGKISYDDGTLLPAQDNFVRLTFYPQTPPLDPATYPRPAMADVNLEAGTFDVISTHAYNDGLTAGKHKVVVSTDLLQQPPRGVPPEYNDPLATPLIVDTAEAPFDIRIRKP